MSAWRAAVLFLELLLFCLALLLLKQSVKTTKLTKQRTELSKATPFKVLIKRFLPLLGLPFLKNPKIEIPCVSQGFLLAFQIKLGMWLTTIGCYAAETQEVNWALATYCSLCSGCICVLATLQLTKLHRTSTKSLGVTLGCFVFLTSLVEFFSLRFFLGFETYEIKVYVCQWGMSLLLDFPLKGVFVLTCIVFRINYFYSVKVAAKDSVETNYTDRSCLGTKYLDPIPAVVAPCELSFIPQTFVNSSNQVTFLGQSPNQWASLKADKRDNENFPKLDLSVMDISFNLLQSLPKKLPKNKKRCWSVPNKPSTLKDTHKRSNSQPIHKTRPKPHLPPKTKLNNLRTRKCLAKKSVSSTRSNSRLEKDLQV